MFGGVSLCTQNPFKKRISNLSCRRGGGGGGTQGMNTWPLHPPPPPMIVLMEEVQGRPRGPWMKVMVKDEGDEKPVFGGVSLFTKFRAKIETC